MAGQADLRFIIIASGCKTLAGGIARFGKHAFALSVHKGRRIFFSPQSTEGEYTTLSLVLGFTKYIGNKTPSLRNTDM
jgi:hypothetical protein